MSSSPDELAILLRQWAADHRLTPAQADSIRANVLATAHREDAFDVDWFWSLLRPVTSLLDQAGVTSPIDEAGESTYLPYLRLA